MRRVSIGMLWGHWVYLTACSVVSLFGHSSAQKEAARGDNTGPGESNTQREERLEGTADTDLKRAFCNWIRLGCCYPFPSCDSIQEYHAPNPLPNASLSVGIHPQTRESVNKGLTKRRKISLSVNQSAKKLVRHEVLILR